MNTARYSKTLQWTATNNNMIPVSSNGRANSLDLFQRKHDKQAIQRLQRVRKIQKPSHHCSQHLGGATTIENPFFILMSTCAGLRVFIRVLVARVVNCTYSSEKLFWIYKTLFLKLNQKSMKKKIDIQLRSARLKVHKNYLIVAKRCFVVLQKILRKVNISLWGKKKKIMTLLLFEQNFHREFLIRRKLHYYTFTKAVSKV